MLGRPGGRIGADLYPTEGKAAGIWRLNEIYNEQRFRRWPLELHGGCPPFSLLPVGTFVEINGAHIVFRGYALHTTNHIKFLVAVKIPATNTPPEFNQRSTKFDSYKVDQGVLS